MPDSSWFKCWDSLLGEDAPGGTVGMRLSLKRKACYFWWEELSGDSECCMQHDVFLSLQSFRGGWLGQAGSQ